MTNKWLSEINEDGWYFMKSPQNGSKICCVEISTYSYTQKKEVDMIGNDMPYSCDYLLQEGYVFMKINMPDFKI